MRLFILILFLALNACHNKVVTKENQIKDNKEILKKNELNLLISSSNLSEDASSLSSNNDELILLIYQDTKKYGFPHRLLYEYFTFDKKNNTKKYKFNLVNQKNIYLFLIEVDTDKTIEQIEPIIRLNIDKISILYKLEDHVGLKKYLGDDDVLGIEKIQIINNEMPKEFLFEGINLFDSFKYQISIK